MNEGFFSASVIKTKVKMKALPLLTHLNFKATEQKKVKKVELPKSKIPQYIMDIECYVNYFLVKFLNIETDEIIDFEQTNETEFDSKRVLHLLSKSEIVTFNGTKYDLLMLRLALKGATNKQLKKASDEIIQDDMRVWKFEEKYALERLKLKHIDLIELIFGIGSLKTYGARLHSKKLQDLPIQPDTVLAPHQMDEICDYCSNDVLVTKMAYTDKAQEIELRRTMSKRYKLDLLSKSDAQIAEAVLKAEIEMLLKKEIKQPEVSRKSFHYKAPDFINFKLPILQDALELVTTKPFTTAHNGVISMPKELTDLQVSVGKSIYTMGMGGLHSTEKNKFYVSDDEHDLYDWDVASYYPSIILQQGLYPKHLGPDFLTVYKEIVDERLEAKRTKDKSKADSLKIVINGSFGKLGQPYSTLYAPELMVQVTVTGQLALLMLIEMLESKGISVVSGNTDGLVMVCPKTHEDTMRGIIKRWEKITGFEMEETKYAGLYSRDVNNYLAIQTDGYVKAKGTFAEGSIKKNPENDICTEAMIEYLKFGTSFMQTIKACYDITKFLTVRRVNGGATKDGKFVGKTIRFYHSTKVTGVISYITSGNKVANSECCRPLMDLPDKFPDDVDYQYYEDFCKEMF